MTLLTIAFRNILKNRRRSLITVTAIAFGFMAVCTFRGYMHDAYNKIALGAIFVENPGHLTVFKRGFLKEGRLYPEKYLFTGAEAAAVLGRVSASPEFVWAAERLCLTGLASNGKVSTIFVADAMDPSRERELWTHYRFKRWISRELLPEHTTSGVFVGPDLLEMLQLRPRDGLVLSATTRYGQINALDATVLGTYATFNAAVNDKYVKMPLTMAQALYDTDGCDRIGVLCRDPATVEAGRQRLQRIGSEVGLALDVRTWREMSAYYKQATDFLDVMFGFLFSITSFIVVLSAVNTMSMAVYERTREIGTLRAIGLKSFDLVALFAWEGAMLGLGGSAAGAVLTVAGKYAVAAAHIDYKPPGLAVAVLVEVDVLPGTLLMGLAFFTLLAVVSAAIPARRSGRMRIVDALTHT